MYTGVNECMDAFESSPLMFCLVLCVNQMKTLYTSHTCRDVQKLSKTLTLQASGD